MRISLDELKSMLWGAAVLLRGKINATGYKEYIFPLVFFKRISDVHLEERRKALEMSGGDEEFADAKENYKFDIPKGCLWDDIREVTENVGQALVTAWARIEQANPDRVVGDRVVEGLGGIFGKRDHWTNKNILTDETLSELIEHFSKIDLSIASCPADEMGNAYEYLVGKFADDAGNTAQEFYTNRTVVELMAEILEPKPGESIYDPTAGTGGMLISCIARCKGKNENWREIKAYGQEQNALTSSVARMNLFLHGVEEFRIINDDTLLRPGFLNAGKLKTFDVVLANPPYSIKQWNRELFAHDPYDRNFLGTPPQGRADYAFIQHILKSMNPKTGRCAILLPHGVLFREEEKEIRKALLDADLLECVIGLAPNLFYNSPMEACIMICRANKPKATKGKVLFINAVNEVTRKNAESKLEPAHIEKIIAAYAKRESDGVFSQVATREEIAAKQDSLAISLYAHVGKGSRGGAETRSLGDALCDYMSSSGVLSAAVADLADMMVGRAVPSAPQPRSNEVCVEKAVAAAKGFAALPTVRVKFDDIAINSVAKKKPTPDDVSTYIGLEHIDPGTFTISRWGGDVAPVGEKLVMKKGDLLFGKRRAYQRKVAIAPFDGIFSAHGMVLRPKTDVVDERYFPFFIASDQFMDEAVRISVGGLSPTINWKTLKECEFDLPPLDRQRELAELLWAANDLKEKYKKLITASDEMLKAKFREMLRGAKCKEYVFAEICKRGPQNGFYRKGAEKNGSVPVLKMKQLFGNESMETADDCDLFAISPAELEKFKLTKDDLVFGRRSLVPEGAGKCRRVGELERSTIFESSMLRVTLNTEVALPYVVQIWSESPVGEKAIAALRSGTTVVGIKGSDLRQMRISLPPLDLQRQFVEIAAQEEKVKANLKKSIADVDNIIKGLING